MKKVIALAAALSVVGVFVLPISADAAITSYGGTVVSTQACNTGLLVYIKSGAATPIPLMWFWGELPFLSYFPPHMGQQILAKTGPFPVPCILGYVPKGAGFPILFHGSTK